MNLKISKKEFDERIKRIGFSYDFEKNLKCWRLMKNGEVVKYFISVNSMLDWFEKGGEEWRMR